jgi:geranylgeranyl diphosphate synthase type I
MAWDGVQDKNKSSTLLVDDEATAAVAETMQRLVRGEGGADDYLASVCEEHLATGGKRARARLALAAAHALGVERARAVPWAAAVELVHNASLVHDDLQDGDRVRRGRETTWVRHGAAQAINAGDLMLVLPFVAVAELRASALARASLSAALARAVAEMARGQADEPRLASACSDGAARAAYTRCIAGKTGALFGVPVEGAAYLAGASASDAQELGAVFARIGVLFQLQDDVLDLFGDKGRERPGNDLYEGKVSALVVEHIERHPDEAAELLALLGRSRLRTPEEEVARWAKRFAEGGALDGALSWIRRIASEVTSVPALVGRRELAALAAELVHAVLRPIEHLFHSSDTLLLPSSPPAGLAPDEVHP